MKKITLLFIGLISILLADAQKSKRPKEAFYMLDANMKSTSQELAKYFIHAKKINDTCWQFDTYNMRGPIISSEQYKDEKAQNANGRSYYYNNAGTVDSVGEYKNGVVNGTWYYFNDTGKVILKKEFLIGLLSSTEDLSKSDSIKNINNSSVKMGDQKIVAKAGDFVSIEIESDFHGGQKQWINYLSKNIAYPEFDIKNKIEGNVVVIFMIDTEGKISDPRLSKSVEYFLDEEALRLIRESPDWTPALQDGKKVKSYKKQPITFRLQ